MSLHTPDALDAHERQPDAARCAYSDRRTLKSVATRDAARYRRRAGDDAAGIGYLEESPGGGSATPSPVDWEGNGNIVATRFV